MCKKYTAKRLIAECWNAGIACNIDYHSTTGISIEIYTRNMIDYKNLFYTDGHVKLKHAIKPAIKFLDKYFVELKSQRGRDKALRIQHMDKFIKNYKVKL